MFTKFEYLGDDEHISNLLSGIHGSLAEERRSPRTNKKLKEELRIRRTLNLDKNKLPLFSFTHLQGPPENIGRNGEVILRYPEETELNQILIYEQLSQITSSYSSMSDIGIRIQGLNSIEGKKEASRFRDLLIFAALSRTPETDFLFMELLTLLLKKFNSKRRIEGIWEDNQILLELSMNKVLLLEYLELRYPDIVSIKRFYQNGKKIAKTFKVSFAGSPAAPLSKRRRKSSDDKGSCQPVHEKHRFKFETSKDLYKYYSKEPEECEITKTGGIILKSKTALDIEQTLLEIYQRSTESYLNWLRKRSLQKEETESVNQTINIRKDTTENE